MPFDADSLLVASRAAPTLDPRILGAAAQNTLDATATLAGSVAAYGGAQKMRAQLEAQDPDIQARQWSTSDDATRRLLLGAGYRPPPVPSKHSHRGLLGSITHDIASGLGAVEGVGAKVVGEALHGAGAPLRSLQHLYRASALITDDNILAGRGQWSLHGTFSPSTWSRVWHQSEHGEQTFSPVSEREAVTKWGPDVVALAKEKASGTSDSEIVASVPEDQRVALARRLREDTDLHDATAFMGAAHLSLGHRLVDPMLAVDHPLLHKLASGGVDALADWYSDPLVVAGKVGKANQIERYLVRDASDVTRLLTNPNVARETERVAALVKQGAGELVAQKPRWADVADLLVQNNVDTAEKLGEWLQGEAGLMAMKSGRLSGMHAAETTIPFLTRRGETAQWIKTEVKGAVDWAADIGPKPLQPVGQFGRKLVTLLPKGSTLKPFERDNVTEFGRVARMFLPEDRARQLVSEWAASAELGQKRNVYLSMLDEMRQVAGIASDNPWWSKLRGSVEGEATRAYSSSGADAMQIAGSTSRQGFLESHLQAEWVIPPYKDFLAQARKARLLGVNSDGVDWFMSSAWKPSMLLRLAFPIRAGGEELVGAILRHGPVPIIRSGMAHGAVQAETAQIDRLLPYHPLHNIYERLTSHLPEQIKAAIDTPGDLVGAYLGDNARRAFRAVEGRLAGEKYLNAARELADDPNVMDAFGRFIAAAEQRGGGYLDPDTLKRIAASDSKTRPAYFKPTGAYRDYRNGDTLFAHQWAKNLQEVDRSQIARTSLEHFGNRNAQVSAVADLLETPGMAKLRERAVRNFALPDARLVGQTATQREALESWAGVVAEHLDSVLRAEDGTVITSVLDALRAGQVPAVSELHGLDAASKPFAVKGPELVAEPRSWMRNLMDHGFEKIVGEPMDWMVRQPLFIHNYAHAREEAESLRVYFGAQADAHLRDVAIERAVVDTIPFIHDPRVRSQFSTVVRNLAPFWFAQEQFYKRFARSLAFNPAAYRQAQLTMGGLRHSGIVHTDDNGNDYFFYPGVGFTQDVIAKGFKLFTGKDVQLPLPVGFSGQVQFATPGLERLGMPSFGPIVGIPMHALAERFPELGSLESAVLGERGTGRAYWEMITPATLSRLVHAVADDPDTSPQMASAMSQAIAYLESTGNGPAEGATAVDIEKWQDKVKDWTRTLFLTRTLFGFGVPAAPQVELDPKHLHDEYRKLLTTLPIETATAEFMRLHPDANAYTVFGSKTRGGGTLPATAASVKFMEANKDLLEAFPSAAGWLLPQVPAKGTAGEFSIVAYREQMAMELRIRKSPDEFYRDVKFAEAADTYFSERDRKDALLAAAKGNSTRRLSIEKTWHNWSTGFMASHPIFAEDLQSPDSTIRRANVLDEMRAALIDPRLPQNAQTANLRTFVDAFDDYKARLDPLFGRSDAQATATRKKIKGIFGAWAKQFAVDNPDVSGFYDRVIRVEVEQ